MPRPRKEFELDEEISRLYYTAQQAQQQLGLGGDRDRFNYIVRTRNIQRVPFLGGNGYYKKSEIDQLASEIYAFLLVGESSNLQYRTATLDDIDTEIELTALNFGSKKAETTRAARIRFLKAIPEMTHYLFSKGQMVASINLLPISHEAILEFRQGKRGWLFKDQELRQFEPGDRLECIIIDCMTTTRVTKDQRFRYASLLLGNLTRVTFVDWANRGIDIASIDACGGTSDGRRISKRAGFELVGVFGERDIYHLDVDQSDLPLLKEYKAARIAGR